MADTPGFAPLTAALVRRAAAPERDGVSEEQVDEPQASVGWHADVRLFAMTWAAGFVFFLVFIA
jgi:hypothetical protein